MISYCKFDFVVFTFLFFAFYSGVWAKFFWLGVVLVGFVLPLVLNFALGKMKFSFYLGSFAAVVGVLLLRVFILYAGQTYSI